MIVDAVIPLLIENGREVSTRQIADAAGIAEGTIFRVFPDKDALFAAAVDKFLDPTAANRALRAIDPSESIENKINDILFLLRSRMTGIFGIMQAVGRSGPPTRTRETENFVDVIADVLAPDLAGLGVPIEQVAHFVRLVSFASAIPQFNAGHEIATSDLAYLITNGIAGHSAEGRGSHAS